MVESTLDSTYQWLNAFEKRNGKKEETRVQPDSALKAPQPKPLSLSSLLSSSQASSTASSSDSVVLKAVDQVDSSSKLLSASLSPAANSSSLDSSGSINSERRSLTSAAWVSARPCLSSSPKTTQDKESLQVKSSSAASTKKENRQADSEEDEEFDRVTTETPDVQYSGDLTDPFSKPPTRTVETCVNFIQGVATTFMSAVRS